MPAEASVETTTTSAADATFWMLHIQKVHVDVRAATLACAPFQC
jgi:hypothetical protein